MARPRKPPRTWDNYARDLGVNLQRLRLERGLSQERLAHIAGISSYTYQKFEKGESKPGTPMNPRLKTIVALAQALSVELADILPVGMPDVTAGR
ncbi:helix-turn-helix domain-containing protein [Psychromicrobium xiongbiense]|uniref:helix-turn-helix domain-containing protein n=1 Tax=Psychromicrobium xiongbiense TaxID=3051184 RepID=UPI00255502C1|nr:helix-turn-helix transcriptional regulator [Psychromicrobium sp. YIM S02556]